MSQNNKKITAPNYTQIPNVIFDYWMAILSPSEFKVLLMICRKTFGWHRESIQLSRTVISKLTNLNRDTVLIAIKSLITHGLVLKVERFTEHGDNDANFYEINISEIEKDEGVGGSLPPQVVGNSDGGLSEIPTTPVKPTYIALKKEDKEIPPNPRCAAKEIFCENVELSKEEHEKLLKLHGPEKLQAMMEILGDYLGSSGKKYKSHYYLLKASGWVHTRYMEKRAPGAKFGDSKDRRMLDIKGNPVANPFEGRF